MLRNMAGLPIVHPTFDQQDQRLKNWRQAVEQSAIGRDHDQYRLDLHINGTELWHLPERFVGRI